MRIIRTERRPTDIIVWQYAFGEAPFQDGPEPEVAGLRATANSPWGTVVLHKGPRWWQGEVDGHRVVCRDIRVWEKVKVSEEIGWYDHRMGLNICPECGQYIIDGYCDCPE